MLELRKIDKYYNPGTVNEMCLFHQFDLKVEQGEFVSVVGSNGSGKTSMLNILCGSIPSRCGTDPDERGRYHREKRIQAQSEDRASISESGDGNLPVYDDSGEYVSGRQ